MLVIAGSNNLSSSVFHFSEMGPFTLHKTDLEGLAVFYVGLLGQIETNVAHFELSSHTRHIFMNNIGNDGHPCLHSYDSVFLVFFFLLILCRLRFFFFFAMYPHPKMCAVVTNPRFLQYIPQSSPCTPIMYKEVPIKNCFLFNKSTAPKRRSCNEARVIF